MRHVGRVQGRLREDAPSAGAERKAASQTRRRFLPQTNASNTETRGYAVFFFGILNAKSQGRGAKSFFRLGLLASWRLLPRKLSGLTVEHSFLAVESAVQFVCLSLRRAVLFCGKFVLIAAPCVAPFAPFCGESTQAPLHEQLARKNELSQSRPIKSNQGKSRYFPWPLRHQNG